LGETYPTAWSKVVISQYARSPVVKSNSALGEFNEENGIEYEAEPKGFATYVPYSSVPAKLSLKIQ
jgi:hypothetical protein